MLFRSLKYLEHSHLGVDGQVPNMMTDFGFLRCIVGFLTGMLLFTMYEHRSGESILRRDWVFLLFFAVTFYFMHRGVSHIAIIALFPFIIMSAAYNQTRVKRILDTKALQRLGDWSFSLYLVHIPIIFTFYIFDIRKDPTLFSDLFKFFDRPMDRGYAVIMCLVITGLSILVSSITYRWVELPARNYFNKLFKTSKPKLKPENVEV